ncbi:hypothetical protein BLNAU_5365 [Blattamonas nauphoetae]|uniref:Uncharacterized protein n=1 Tax=Blattamonas nauphoetae TaxID=2049346 RepID=A0ABQ9Y788_9EUKA|nr:hypothetical protein BLNAU_5365 [Blattamonas nauphoetae]
MNDQPLKFVCGHLIKKYPFETVPEKAVVFRSLVATLKLQPALDDSLEAKAVKFLESVAPPTIESGDDFLNNVESSSDHNLTDFVQSIVVLISSASHTITTAAMKMLKNLINSCSFRYLRALIRADLVPQLVVTLSPQSLSFPKSQDIHTCLLLTFGKSFSLTIYFFDEEIGVNRHDKQQAVCETVLKQVLFPSEKYIRYLCVNRCSIVDGEQSKRFLVLLSRILQTSRYHQPTMDFVLHMPLFFTIPSCLTIFEANLAIWYFLQISIDSQREWSRTKGTERHMLKKLHQMLRMEGFEDVLDERLRRPQRDSFGFQCVDESIKLSNLHGMNLSQ